MVKKNLLTTKEHEVNNKDHKKINHLIKNHMVKHIVFFKITKYNSLKERDLQVKRLDEIFSPLGRLLPFIVDFKKGINYNEASFAWDFAIDSVFRNKEDLDKYMMSREHLDAVKTASTIEKTKAVIDYEF